MKLDAIDLLAKLVSFDTTSAKSNLACINFIRDYLSSFKIDSVIVGNDDGTKACVLASLGPKTTGGLMLAGHSDVVPVDGQTWTSDPFKLREDKGLLYARGACDMKGFIACALASATSLQSAALKKPLHLAFTYNEEVDMEGAHRLTSHLKQTGIKPDWTWIGEPTLLNIVDAHKGVAAFSTEINGVSGHSGQPDLGLNAIDLGSDFLNIVREEAAAKKAAPFKPSRFDPPYTTFNLGIVKGGTAENIIAEHFNILWQVRTHPGDDLKSILASVESETKKRLVPRCQAFLPAAGVTTCTCFDIPPLKPSANNPGSKSLSTILGKTETEAVSFGTEAGFFQDFCQHAIVCGPGSIEQAHQPDEFIAVAEINACMGLLPLVFRDQGLF